MIKFIMIVRGIMYIRMPFMIIYIEEHNINNNLQYIFYNSDTMISHNSLNDTIQHINKLSLFHKLILFNRYRQKYPDCDVSYSYCIIHTNISITRNDMLWICDTIKHDTFIVSHDRLISNTIDYNSRRLLNVS